MTMLIFLITTLVGLEEPKWIRTPKYQYFCTPQHVHFIEYKNWRVEDEGKKWFVDATIMSVSYETALQMFVAGHLTQYNLEDFSVLSRHWRPIKPEQPPLPQPSPTPQPPQTAVIYYVKSKTSWIYHLPSCRYANVLMQRIEADEADSLQPCKACKPNELDSILKEFLPQ